MRSLLVPLVLVCSSLATGQSTQRPNILLVYADDLAEAAVSCYGSRLHSTPHIDSLAKAGMRFSSSFVTNSICGPSRAVLLTGLHSHLNGKTTNGSSFRDELPSFPKLLQAAGYSTAVIGKWHLPTDPSGFDHYSLVQRPYYGTSFRTSQGTTQYEGHCTDLITEQAVSWLKAREDDEKPFFLWVSHKAAHRTWDPAPRHLKLYGGETLPEPATLFDDYAGRSRGAVEAQMRIARDLFPAYDLKLPVTGDGILDNAAVSLRSRMTEAERASWDAAYGPENEAFAAAKLEGDDLVRWKYQRYVKDYLRCATGLDESLGTVLATLDELGLRENTIIVYTSDQGFFLGEHGWYDKRWMYEPSLRTPLIVSWPGVTDPGSTCDELVQNLDLAQTFLNAAKIDAPDSMQGASLVPLLAGEQPEQWRDAVYYHYHQQDSGRTSHTVARHFGVRTRRYKLIRLYDLDAWELYDLQRDPHEILNLADDPDYAQVRKQLTARLVALRAEYGDETGTL